MINRKASPPGASAPGTEPPRRLKKPAGAATLRPRPMTRIREGIEQAKESRSARRESRREAPVAEREYATAKRARGGDETGRTGSPHAAAPASEKPASRANVPRPARDGAGTGSQVGSLLHRDSSLWKISPRLVVLGLLIIVFVGFSFGPTMRNLEATSKLKRREADLRSEQQATKALKRQAKEARSMEYVEKEARKQRLVAPGEVLYLVTNEDTDGKSEYRVKEIQSMEEAWQRVRFILTGGGTRGEEP